mgnify:CR=1 FL=1
MLVLVLLRLVRLRLVQLQLLLSRLLGWRRQRWVHLLRRLLRRLLLLVVLQELGWRVGLGRLQRRALHRLAQQQGLRRQRHLRLLLQQLGLVWLVHRLRLLVHQLLMVQRLVRRRRLLLRLQGGQRSLAIFEGLVTGQCPCRFDLGSHQLQCLLCALSRGLIVALFALGLCPTHICGGGLQPSITASFVNISCLATR